MGVVQWDPWKELAQLREQTDRLWDSFLAKLTSSQGSRHEVRFLPDVDMVETAEDLRVYVSAPGMVEEDIEISAAPNTLVVRGQRESPYDASRSCIREWRYGFFERRLSLPAAVYVERIRASYDAGVLTIILPKRDAGEPGASSR